MEQRAALAVAAAELVWLKCGYTHIFTTVNHCPGGVLRLSLIAVLPHCMLCCQHARMVTFCHSAGTAHAARVAFQDLPGRMLK